MPIKAYMTSLGGGRYRKRATIYRMRGPSHAASMYRAGLVPRGRYSRKPRNLKSEIKKIVNGTQETKLVISSPRNFNSATNLEQFTNFTSAITSTNEVYGLIPPVIQGSDDHQRVGNTIQPVSLNTMVNVTLVNGSASVYADIFFCTAKAVKSYGLTPDVPTGQLFNDGQGANVAYDGTSFTAMLPINKSEFTILHKRRIKLQSALGDPNTALSGGGGASTSVFPYSASFSVKIPLPSKLVFEDNTKDYPSNSFPFMMVGFCGTDQHGNTSPTSARIQVQAQSHLYYKDA